MSDARLLSEFLNSNFQVRFVNCNFIFVFLLQTMHDGDKFKRNGLMGHRKCVKCLNPGTLGGLDFKKAVYCKECFLHMVRHKFRATIGKQRIYKESSAKETLVVFDGSSSSVAMLQLVKEGTSGETQKRLSLRPTFVTVITEENDDRINAILEKVKTTAEDLGFPWIAVHLASVYEQTDAFPDTTSIWPASCSELFGYNRIGDLTSLMLSVPCSTSKQTLAVNFKKRVLFKLAQRLSVDKILVSTCLDELATTVLNQVALGCGSQITFDTSVLDRRHFCVTIVRPMRDLSLKECGLFNHFLDLSKYLVLAGNAPSAVPENSIQSVTDSFVSSLQAGFQATVTTLISTAGKLRPVSPAETACKLCLSPSDLTFCHACSMTVKQVTDVSLLPYWLREL